MLVLIQVAADEDEAARVDPCLMRLPALAFAGDVRLGLLPPPVRLF